MPRARKATRVERVHRMWDDIADFDASRVDDALVHALASLASIVEAQNAYWLGAVRLGARHVSDPMCGWRPRAIRFLHPSVPDAAVYKRASQALNAGNVDESTRGNVRNAGTFRAQLLRELVSKSWFKTPFYDMAYRSRRVVDAVFVVAPVSRDAESYFGFHRSEGQPLFTRRDRDLLAYALRSQKWFHRQVMLSHGLLVARTPLTPLEQRVLRLLLTSLSETEIAHRLGLTPRTTHGYVTAILRKFGVSGRAGLTALWLGGRSDTPAN